MFRSVLEEIRAAATLVLPVDNESTIFSAVMNEVMTLHADTVSHIPRSVRPLIAQVLAVKLRHACYDGLWSFASFFYLLRLFFVCHIEEEGKETCHTLFPSISFTPLAGRSSHCVMERSQM